MRYAEKPFTVASSAMPHWYPLAQCSDGAFRTVTRSGHVRLDVLPMPPRLLLRTPRGDREIHSVTLSPRVTSSRDEVPHLLRTGGPK